MCSIGFLSEARVSVAEVKGGIIIHLKKEVERRKRGREREIWKEIAFLLFFYR